MRRFIAYDKDTYRILGFIENDYTDITETEEVFKNFDDVIHIIGYTAPVLTISDFIIEKNGIFMEKRTGFIFCRLS